MYSVCEFCRFGEGVNREALWQVLKMYGVSCKLFSGIKSTYVDSLACVRVKGVES